jgi:hypothetical protein
LLRSNINPIPRTLSCQKVKNNLIRSWILWCWKRENLWMHVFVNHHVIRSKSTINNLSFIHAPHPGCNSGLKNCRICIIPVIILRMKSWHYAKVTKGGDDSIQREMCVRRFWSTRDDSVKENLELLSWNKIGQQQWVVDYRAVSYITDSILENGQGKQKQIDCCFWLGLKWQFHAIWWSWKSQECIALMPLNVDSSLAVCWSRAVIGDILDVTSTKACCSKRILTAENLTELANDRSIDHRLRYCKCKLRIMWIDPQQSQFCR